MLELKAVFLKGLMSLLHLEAVVLIEIRVLLSKGEVPEWPWLFWSTVSNCEAVSQWSGTIKAAATAGRERLFYMN